MGNNSAKLENSNGLRNLNKGSISNWSKGYPEFLLKLGHVLEKKSFDEEGRKGITKNIFKKYLSKESETAANALFEYFLIQEKILVYDDSKKDTFVENSDDKVLSCEKFVKQASIILNCQNETKQLEYFIKMFARGKEEITQANFFNLIGASYEIAQHSTVFSDDLLAALSKAVMQGKDEMLCTQVLNWCCENCPRLVMWMHQYLSHILRVGYSTIPKNEETEQNYTEKTVLDYANKSYCGSLHPALLWMLSCSLPACFTSATSSPPGSPSNDTNQLPQHLILGQTPTHWASLFNSNEHGMSINRFKHHVFDYQGPTLLFVTTDDKSLFCVACDQDWRDSNKFFGGYESMCIQLLPEYKIIERGQNLLYFTVKGFPPGFQIGTDPKSRILTIDLNLDNVEYKRLPLKLKSLEVWGCGSSHAKTKQLQTKKQANRDAEKASKVKLDASEWNDNPDRFLLEISGTRPNYAKFEKDTQNQK